MDADRSPAASTLPENLDETESELYRRYLPMAFYLPPTETGSCSHASKRVVPTLLSRWRVSKLPPPPAGPYPAATPDTGDDLSVPGGPAESSEHPGNHDCSHHCAPHDVVYTRAPFSSADLEAAEAAQPKVIGGLMFMLKDLAERFDRAVTVRDEEIQALQDEIVKKNHELAALKKKKKKAKKAAKN